MSEIFKIAKLVKIMENAAPHFQPGCRELGYKPFAMLTVLFLWHFRFVCRHVIA